MAVRSLVALLFACFAIVANCQLQSQPLHLLHRSHHVSNHHNHHHNNNHHPQSSVGNNKTAVDKGFNNNRIKVDSPMGCKELRSKRYISDGLCTSVKPITEVVCSGYCLPVKELPWYAQYVKIWSRKTVDEWRCVEDVVRHKRVYLLCENGERRAYRIRVVRACKCKKYKKPHNKTSRKSNTNNLE